MNSDLRVGGARTILVGMAVILVGFGGLGTWAATAPLDSAAVAAGEVKVENYRKTVQHREGGIVRAIPVRDGVRVTAGQPVLRLDDTAVRAEFAQLQNRWWDALGTRARLVAERDGAPAIDFSGLRGGDARIAEVKRAQQNLFDARRTLLTGQTAVLRKRIELMRREAEALEAERLSKHRQLTLVEEEIRSVEGLLRKGLTNKPRLLALKREAAQLRGEHDDYGARIARVGQGIAATELDIANLTHQRLDEVATGLREAETSLRDIEQRMTAVKDALTRTVVRAPQDGVVMGLKVHTVGAVLQPGEAVMDIVPENETLVVEARIKPEDIDRVTAGRPAQLRFRAFLRALTPPADGTVIQVSADLFTDERTGQGYYLARIRPDPGALDHLPGPLTPGMQTDVLITTGERTALGYLVDPLLRAAALGMRER